MKSASWIAAACMLATAGPALAAGEANPFAGTIYQSIAAVIVFVVLYIALKSFAWGPILKGLQDREEKIKQDLASAERSSKQAAETLREYQQQLSEAQAQAREVIEKARTDAERIGAQMRSKTEQEINQLRQRAEQDIEAAKEQALNDIYARVADLSTAVAGQILKREIQPQDQQQLVDAALEKLSNN